MVIILLKSFFQDDGIPEGLLQGREDACEGVFLLFLYVWFLLLPSTRGSSDSVAPRDSLPTGESGRERLPPPSPRSVHAGEKSGVGAEPRPGQPQSESRAPLCKDTSKPLQIPPIHPLAHSSMVIPRCTGTKRKI